MLQRSAIFATNNSISISDRLNNVENFLDELAANYHDPGNTEHSDGMMNHNGMHEHDGKLSAASSMEHYHMNNGGTIMHDHKHGGHEHVMKMWFHSGYHEIILFEFWQIDSLIGLLFSCLLIFIMACLYEGIKWFRVYLQLSSARCPPSCRHADNEQEKMNDGKCTDCKLVSTPLTNKPCVRTRSKGVSPTVRFLQAILYLVQLTLAYWLMLIAMTYNIWLTGAVIMGAVFGHWLFAILNCFNPQTDEFDTFATDACH